jgi:tetratricopeptide (TPR) repeat protein
MNRSDHSMLPPTPAATMAYQSPNACNICHTDKDAAWSDQFVRQWRTRDYQAPILMRAGLIDAARKRDWSRLPDMLAYISDPQHDEIFTASLIRLIPPAPDPKLLTALLAAAEDPSPLVRGAAARAIGMIPAMESVQALIMAAEDDYRLVRIRAAEGMAAFPEMTVPPAYQAPLKKANEEYVASITARPDQWMSHYNLGNTLLGLGELKNAAASYQTALSLNPQAIMAMVNASIAWARMGETEKAERSLHEALIQAPDNAAANLNMGLLKAEKNDLKAAEKHFKAAFAADPRMAQAAYNLCIITAGNRMDEAVAWCRKASDLMPQEPKYAYTLAFYLNQKGDRAEAIMILKGLTEKYPQYKNAEMLLKEISR